MSALDGNDVTRRLIPAAVMKKICNASPSARRSHHEHTRRYREMSDDDLLDSTRNAMRNLEQVEDGPDLVLRAVIVPECWERIRPGTRDELRSIVTAIAEWNEETTSGFTLALREILGAEKVGQIREESRRLRQDIEEAARADTLWLVEQMLFLLAGSRAYEGEGRLPTDPVYEPAFAYRLVPEIARRMLERQRPG